MKGRIRAFLSARRDDGRDLARTMPEAFGKLPICPWCEVPVRDDDTIQVRAGVVWHAACKDRFDAVQRRARGNQ